MSRAMQADRERIRAAFASREFTEARRLWDAYAEKLREAILSHSATEQDMEETRRLVDWARVQVKCFRAHAGIRIAGAKGAAAYASSPTPAPLFRISF